MFLPDQDGDENVGNGNQAQMGRSRAILSDASVDHESEVDDEDHRE